MSPGSLTGKRWLGKHVQPERTNTGRNLFALKLICTWRLKGLSAYQVIKEVFSLAENRHMPKHTWVKFLKASSL